MRYSFTGSASPLTNDQIGRIGSIITKLEYPKEFTTGAAYGVDSQSAVHAAMIYPDAQHRIIIPAKPYNEEIVETVEKITSNLEVVRMPSNTNYRDRNERLVDYCQDGMLIGFPKYEEERSVRSGTWMTIRMARRRKIAHYIHVLEPHQDGLSDMFSYNQLKLSHEQ